MNGRHIGVILAALAQMILSFLLLIRWTRKRIQSQGDRGLWIPWGFLLSLVLALLVITTIIFLRSF